jgi:Rrf2 family transcriptional regulator, nitric oxide-sensitive transcriptional repressor
MRLVLWTDYALRALIYVGAKTFGVSRSHLMKIVNRLAQQGYLDTAPRRGIRLGRPASAIRVGAVVRDTEEELAVMGWGVLPNRGTLRAPPGAAGGDERAFRGSRSYTLADLLAQQIALAASLGLLSASPPRCERGPGHDTPWMTSLSPGRSTFSPSSSGSAVLRW